MISLLAHLAWNGSKTLPQSKCFASIFHGSLYVRTDRSRIEVEAACRPKARARGTREKNRVTKNKKTGSPIAKFEIKRIDIDYFTEE